MLDIFVLTILQMNLGASTMILFLFVFQYATHKLKVKMASKYYYFLWVIAFLHLAIPFGVIGEKAIFLTETDDSRTEEGSTASLELPEEEDWDMKQKSRVKTEKKKTAKLTDIKGVYFVEMPVIYFSKAMLLVLKLFYFPGMLFMAVQKCREHVRFRRELARSVIDKNGKCRNAWVEGAFSMGIVFPRIILPMNLPSEYFESVLSHEETHIKRGDLVIKGIAEACFVVHWFNPLIRPAYACMEQEMEKSCDERVIDEFGEEKRMSYLKSLIKLSTEEKEGVNHMGIGYSRRKSSAKTRERIDHAIHYEKAGIGKRVLSSLLCLGLMVCTVIVSFCVPTCTKAYAAGEDTRVNPPLPEGWSVEGGEVTTFSAADMEGQWIQEGMQLVDQQVEVMPPSRDRADVSYETETHTFWVSIYQNDWLKLRATCDYTVYYYTDGKVHLYSRRISLYTASDFSNSFVTYGRIINTDGSSSGTQGDKFTAIQGSIRRTFLLNFYVDSTDGPNFTYGEFTN